MNKELEKLKQENKRLTAELSQSKAKNLEQENSRYIDGLMQEGVLFPSQKDDALALLNIATGYDSGQVITLSEGESLEGKVKALLSTINKVNLSMQTIELGMGNKPTIWRVDENATPRELDKQIKRYMQLHNVDYKTAFQKLTDGEK
ncbi:hypothetical protein [Pasteurella sp. PK-2025]|uniref:hypothetical protein n=1 Tax=Pasteurella sp. PK-2025 TaxID=3413133 RepID=UPI003C713D7C